MAGPLHSLCLRWLAPLLLLGNPALADDMDDILGGFDDGLLNDIEISEEPEQPSYKRKLLGWTTSGNLAASAAWNIHDHESSTGTDYSGLSKLRIRAQLDLERSFETLNLGFTQLGSDWQAKFSAWQWIDFSYGLHDRNYSDEVLDEYQIKTEIDDAWLQGRLSDHWDVKIGRQVIVWGYSDNLRVLDQLNPLDNLEPGIADIEDLRLPVGMIALDHYRELAGKRWKFSFIAIPENRFSWNPPIGSDFYAFEDMNGNAIRIPDQQPDSFERINWAAAAFGGVFGLDTQIIATRRWQDRPYVETDNEGTRLAYSRIATLGFGLQKNLGSWLLKQEANYLADTHINSLTIVNLPGTGPTAIPDDVETDQYELLLGLEYFGLKSTTIAVDVSARWLADFDDDLERAGQHRQRNETALRLSRDYLNERLRITALAILLSDDGEIFSRRGGALSRLSADYEWRNNLTLSGGFIVYGNGNQPPFNVAGENDRVFVQLKLRL